ncbi:MAG: DsbA family protein [Polymorphobacter sp.]
MNIFKSERSRMALVGVAVAALSVGIFASGRAAHAAPEATARFAPADRAAIEAIVRDYILTHPEIIPEAINGMQAREVSKLLASIRADIEAPFAGAVAGNPKGDTTLVVFFDYGCPYCRASHADVTRLIATDPGLRVVFRDFPVLGPNSEEAALASLAAAQQNRYMIFNDKMFDQPGKLSRERIIATVRTSGLNEVVAAKAMQSAMLKAEVDRNLEFGRALGLTGTPSYVIGDQILSGAVGFDALQAAVADARAARAKARS